MKNILKSLFLSTLFFITPIKAQIDFAAAHYTRLHFPKDFIFGVMQAGAQSELSNSFKAAHTHELKSMLTPLGVNGFEFAVDWREIEPEDGKFNMSALAMLAQKCAMLKELGIAVVVVLHHNANPDWFNARNGFEDGKNNAYFVRFAKMVVEAIADSVDMIVTFHQPAGYALEHFFRGNYAPFKKDLQLSLNVLKNMLDSHVLTYHMIKSLRECVHIKVGIAHHIMPVEPYYDKNPLDVLASSIADKLNNSLLLEFFRDGRLKFMLPYSGKKYVMFARINHENAKARGSLDFIGLNYLSNLYVKNFKPVKNPTASATDHDLLVSFPQGLYDAIQMCAQLGLPIHILGNGITTSKDMQRELFFKEHLFAVHKSLADGYDVKSYFYRFIEDDLNDNYQFGLYEVDRESLKRSLRPSAAYLVEVIKMHQKNNKQ